MNKPKPTDKSFAIPKLLVWEAYRRVAANKGAPGVDGQDLAAFEADLESNLYKVWNRMSSGTWFPPPVRAVEIPKPHGTPSTLTPPHDRGQDRSDGRGHVLGAAGGAEVPSPDSYGYRPGKAALDAVATCRQRCWEYDWVIDLDVQKFFDTVPWDLIVRAVETVTDCRWVLLYVKRWLEAPLQQPDGSLIERTKGTPQGSAISPCLANLFMHYAFDSWMVREFPDCPFERYADDGVVHCKTRRQAEHVLDRIAQRMAEVGLTLNPDKTRIVYCKDSNRQGEHEHISFTFLGFAFRPREVGDRAAVEYDIKRLLIKKARQLDHCIHALIDGRATIPAGDPEVDMGRIERIWPVIVTAGNITQTQPLWLYIHSKLGGELQQPKVQPLTILDVEDLELVCALVEQGNALHEILAAKTQHPWAELELAWWLIRDPAAPHITETRPAYVEETWERAVNRSLAMMDMTKGIPATN